MSNTKELEELLADAAKTIGSLKRSMMAHPDCEEGSEFDDYTSTAQEMEDKIETYLRTAAATPATGQGIEKLGDGRIKIEGEIYVNEKSNRVAATGQGMKESDWNVLKHKHPDTQKDVLESYKQMAKDYARLEELEKQVGQIEEGQHPDEIKPRAETWLQERANWQSEVDTLRAKIAEQELIINGIEEGADEWRMKCDDLQHQLNKRQSPQPDKEPESQREENWGKWKECLRYNTIADQMDKIKVSALFDGKTNTYSFPTLSVVDMSKIEFEADNDLWITETLLPALKRFQAREMITGDKETLEMYLSSCGSIYDQIEAVGATIDVIEYAIYAGMFNEQPTPKSDKEIEELAEAIFPFKHYVKGDVNYQTIIAAMLEIYKAKP
jgi:hypothetical protein